MSQSEDAPEAAGADGADGAWAQSLRELMLHVIHELPDHATLGELIEAARKHEAMAPVLEIFTVAELIEAAKSRTQPAPRRAAPPPGEIQLDEDGNPIMDLEAGTKVIRRRADVADGDTRVLKILAERGAQREGDLTSLAQLTGEQMRIILRSLKAKGFVHVEGSGTKRRLKITRHGGAFLRKL